MRWLPPTTLQAGRLLTLASLPAFGAGLVAAVTLAIVDVYMTGHGGESLTRPWISWGPWFQLSRSDAVLCFATLAAGGASLLLARQRMEPK
jgi:hypothetical protein